jgi:hypothetical protein
LQTDNSPVKHILLKFTVGGLNGQPITSAKLRLYNVDASSMTIHGRKAQSPGTMPPRVIQLCWLPWVR